MTAFVSKVLPPPPPPPPNLNRVPTPMSAAACWATPPNRPVATRSPTGGYTRQQAPAPMESLASAYVRLTSRPAALTNTLVWLSWLPTLRRPAGLDFKIIARRVVGAGRAGVKPRLDEQQFRQQPVGPHHPTGRWPHDRRQVATRWPTHGSKRQHRWSRSLLLTSD